MKNLLVGSTGFVGGNLMASHNFEACCHSADIMQYYDSCPSLCIYAGVPSAMFLANNAPEEDLEVMKSARLNLQRIRPKRVVLISTIAVYSDSRGKNEQNIPEGLSLPAYGKNRLMLEEWVREDFPSACIIRLPALYGKGLKKNFLYDLHTITPGMLRQEIYNQLSEKSPLIRDSYTEGKNGFYLLRENCSRKKLREWFLASDFNALNFTDSRSKFQFYPLSRLWSDITVALREKLELVHLCTPPISAIDVYKRITGKSDWENHIVNKPPFDYDLHTLHASLLGGNGTYLCTKEQELEDIERFMKSWQE